MVDLTAAGVVHPRRAINSKATTEPTGPLADCKGIFAAPSASRAMRQALATSLLVAGREQQRAERGARQEGHGGGQGSNGGVGPGPRREDRGPEVLELRFRAGRGRRNGREAARKAGSGAKAAAVEQGASSSGGGDDDDYPHCMRCVFLVAGGYEVEAVEYDGASMG